MTRRPRDRIPRDDASKRPELKSRQRPASPAVDVSGNNTLRGPAASPFAVPAGAAPFSKLAGHSFVFVGGMPQSGTSFLRQLVLANSKIASGQDKCRRTTRCEFSNIEGQWLLDSTDLSRRTCERPTVQATS